MYSKQPLSLRVSNQKLGKIYILPHPQHATFYTPLILLDMITQIKYKNMRYIYRVIQEESARLREMIVCVIPSKKVHINMCPIFDGYGAMGIFLIPVHAPREPRLRCIILATGLLCMGMDERTGLQCEGGNAADLIRMSQRKLQATRARSSRPSGSLFCGRRWHFRKPALSTDQFKLKVIL